MTFTKDTPKIATTLAAPNPRPTRAPNKLTTEKTPVEVPYRNYHQFDEDGNEWPKPRLVQKCNTSSKADDDVIDYVSAASSIHGCVYVVIATLVSVLVVV